MNVASLIRALKGGLPFPALEELNNGISESNDSKSIIHDVLLVSTNCSDILDLLDGEKRTMKELSTILTALANVLFGIAGDLSEFKAVGVHITRSVLNDHGKHLYRLLSPSGTANGLQAALRCLTGMVMVSGVTATEVLTALNWDTISFTAIINRRDLKVARDTRAWCVYFLLAFLNVTENDVTKQFLSNEHLLPLLFPGLIWDPCERVLNVLRVIHKSVLLNPAVSKTIKCKLFTKDTVKPFIELYNWKGPTSNKGKRLDIIDDDEEMEQQTKEERKQIQKLLQEMMLTLCSSVKYGITFKEKEQISHKSNNMHVYRIISLFESPWESSEGRELVSSVLGACPDLMKLYLPSLKDHLVPRPASAFISLLEFFVSIIEHQDPYKKTVDKSFFSITSFLLPLPLSPSLFTSLLHSPFASVRYGGISLIFTILNKTKKTLQEIKLKSSLTQEDLRNLERKTIESVFKVIGRIDGIVHCWKLACGLELPTIADGAANESLIADTADSVPLDKVLMTILKVIILYSEMLPPQVIKEAVNPLSILQNIRDISKENENEDELNKVESTLELSAMALSLLVEFEVGTQDIKNEIFTLEANQELEKNIFYQLVITYAESQKLLFSTNDKAKKDVMINVMSKCEDILSKTLAKNGLSPHFEGNIQFWLQHLKGNEIKLCKFLTHVIQKTRAGLSQYTDLLVDVAAKYHAKESENGRHQTYLDLDDLESLDIVDNEDVSALSIPLPFSRMLAAASDLIMVNADIGLIEYFSHVVEDYLHTLSDPGFLSSFLLQRETALNSELKLYLKYWSGSVDSSDDLIYFLNKNKQSSFSNYLKYMFVSRNYEKFKESLELDIFKNAIGTKDVTLNIHQLLAYLRHELSSEKQSKREEIISNYCFILNHIYSELEDENEYCDSAVQVLKLILEHPIIIDNYQPLTTSKWDPVTDMIQEFIILVFEKHQILAPSTLPYFDKVLKALRSCIVNQDTEIDFFKVIGPFVSLRNTVLTYEALEELANICLKSQCFSTPTLGKLAVQVFTLLEMATNNKRKPLEQSEQLITRKFIEWGSTVNDKNVNQLAIIKILEKNVIKVMRKGSNIITKEDIKQMMNIQPPCVNLCLHITSVEPSYTPIIAKRIKKQGPVLPAQAELLVALLEQDESEEIALGALKKCIEDIKSWCFGTGENYIGYPQLLNHCLLNELMDSAWCVTLCKHVYKIVVDDKQVPPSHIASLAPIFFEAARCEDFGLLPLGNGFLALLLVCVVAFGSQYGKKTQDTKMCNGLIKIMKDLLPIIPDTALVKCMKESSLWPTFMKQVLKKGLRDEADGSAVLEVFQLFCSGVYKAKGGIEPSPAIVYQMILSHSNYRELLFSREEKAQKLRECVISLQQCLVDCGEDVCQERHVPLLLGAYDATMSAVDQHILKLLQTYETKQQMQQYQPLLWGEAAVTHFALQTAGTSGFTIYRKPKPEQIFGQLNTDKVLESCFKFNNRLQLEVKEIVADDPTIYDLRFLLPLMLYIGSNREVGEMEYVESGAVSIAFAALNSHDTRIWGAGAAILKNMVEWMEKSRHRRLRLQWIWLVGVVRFSMNGRQRRLSSIMTNFLIQAAHLLPRPEHVLYKPVFNYIYLRPNIRLFRVPELYRLYSSEDIEHHGEQLSFLLELLHRGIREPLDFKVTQRNYVTKLVMALLQSPTLSTTLRVQTLQVLESMASVTSSAVELVSDQNLLTVLPLSILNKNSQKSKQSSHSDIPQLVAGVTRVMCRLWETLSSTVANQDETNATDDAGEKNMKRPETGLKRKKKDNGKPSINKKPRKETNDESNSDSSSDESEEEDIEDDPKIKLLPPLFVSEYVCTLLVMAPSVVNSSSNDILGEYLQLLMELVKYVDKIAILSEEKHTFRTVSLSPEKIRRKISNELHWSILLERVHKVVNDSTEVRLMGIEAVTPHQQQIWRTEPLYKCVQNVTVNLNKQEDEDIVETDLKKQNNLVKMIDNLLNVIGK